MVVSLSPKCSVNGTRRTFDYDREASLNYFSLNFDLFTLSSGRLTNFTRIFWV